jgi:hypothetical protein
LRKAAQSGSPTGDVSSPEMARNVEIEYIPREAITIARIAENCQKIQIENLSA